MTEAVSPGAAPSAADSQLSALREKIGWLCQFVRFAALAYSGFVIVASIIFWSDEAGVTERYRNLFGLDVSGLNPWQRLCAFGVVFCIWAIAAGACYSAWRLFSLYLTGRIFAVDAAIWLRRVALFGAVATIADIVTRPLISVILTAHMPPGRHMVSVFIRPEDISNLMLLVGLLAIAHIFKTAAEIAGEHAQFV